MQRPPLGMVRSSTAAVSVLVDDHHSHATRIALDLRQGTVAAEGTSVTADSGPPCSDRRRGVTFPQAVQVTYNRIGWRQTAGHWPHTSSHSSLSRRDLSLHRDCGRSPRIVPHKGVGSHCASEKQILWGVEGPPRSSPPHLYIGGSDRRRRSGCILRVQ